MVDDGEFVIGFFDFEFSGCWFDFEGVVVGCVYYYDGDGSV